MALPKQGGGHPNTRRQTPTDIDTAHREYGGIEYGGFPVKSVEYLAVQGFAAFLCLVYRGRLRPLAAATTAGWLRLRCSSSMSLGRSQLAMTVQFGRWKDHH